MSFRDAGKQILFVLGQRYAFSLHFTGSICPFLFSLSLQISCKSLYSHLIWNHNNKVFTFLLLLLLYFCDIIHILVFIHPVNIALPACVSVPAVFLLSFHLEELTSKCFPEAELLTQAISSKVAAQERLRSIGARATQVTFKGPLANLALPPSSPCSSPLTYLWPRYCGDSYQEFTFFFL